jgi:hypothetical protein
VRLREWRGGPGVPELLELALERREVAPANEADAGIERGPGRRRDAYASRYRHSAFTHY